jgi:hypothetical protein
VKKDLGTAAKGLNVGGVLGKQGNDFSGDMVLAAQISEGSNHKKK